MRRAIKRQRTIVGRLARKIYLKASAIGQTVREALDAVSGKAQRIGAQSAQRKAIVGKPKRLTAQESRQLKRRQAIEPTIGHLKADHRMDRCHLNGEDGDRLHAMLCAASYNIKWLLRMIARKGVPFLWRFFFAPGKRDVTGRVMVGDGRTTSTGSLDHCLGIQKTLLLTTRIG